MSIQHIVASVLGIGVILASAVAADNAPPATSPAATDPGVSPTLGALPPRLADGKTHVLCDGAWRGWHQRNGAPSRWRPQGDGSVVVDGGDAITDEEFTDFQLHLEFMCPTLPGATGQARSNSGVYLHGRYEVQVLGSFGDPPAPDNCGAIYSIAPPMVAASRPTGVYQTYDIVFRAPRYEADGTLAQHARVTVVHNGVVIHNNLELPHTTPGGLDGEVVAQGPILLQDHGDPIHYRNVWVRAWIDAVRVLLIIATTREAEALDVPGDVDVLVSGIGRTNAACATTAALLETPRPDAVVNVGIAGTLPGSGLRVGDVVLASACVYAEEGLMTPRGFANLESIGFSLGDFEGNTVPVDPKLLALLEGEFAIGPIATVATGSGTDAAALTIARRTDAVAEAMEGAAVVHAARRLGAPAIELRSISNQTGDRAAQGWDLTTAFASLADAVHRAVARLHAG